MRRLSILAKFVACLMVAWAASAENPARQLLEEHKARNQASQPRKQPATQSPFFNVQHYRDVPNYNRGGSVTRVETRPGGQSVVLGPGLVINHRPSNHRPGYYWVPGRYEWVTRSVWVPGYWEEEYIPPVYETRVVDGKQIVVLVREGFYDQYWVEGYYEYVRERVWVQGYWRPD